MRPASLITLLGFITLIAATYCPMLRPFHLMNWNVYKLNQPYGMVIMLVGVIGILCTVLNQAKVTRIAAWASLVLVVLLFIAAILKVKTTFSFIPFRGINGFLTKQIAFKWGWYVLFAGSALSVIGALASKKRIYTEGE
jgi:predicted membrane channel-forming protein YqfA (hemolysin III family)